MREGADTGSTSDTLQQTRAGSIINSGTPNHRPSPRAPARHRSLIASMSCAGSNMAPPATGFSRTTSHHHYARSACSSPHPVLQHISADYPCPSHRTCPDIAGVWEQREQSPRSRSAASVSHEVNQPPYQIASRWIVSYNIHSNTTL